MRKMLKVSLISIAAILSGCGGGDPVKTEQMTVAKAQREIRIGMSSSEVIEVMGSPNMVTTDDQRRETWVYDKVSSNVSSSGGGVWLLVAGYSSGKSSSNQRTLTIIVRFDEHSKVRDFSYRSSSF